MDTFGPGLVQDEPARVRMALGHQPEQIAHLALVPVSRWKRWRDRREHRPGRIDRRLDAHPALAHGEHVAQLVRSGTSAIVQTDHRGERRPRLRVDGEAGRYKLVGRNHEPVLVGGVAGPERRARQRGGERFEGGRRRRIGRVRQRHGSRPVATMAAACSMAPLNQGGTHSPSPTTPTARAAMLSAVVGCAFAGSRGRAGRPSTIGRTWAQMAAKMVARSAIRTMPITYALLLKLAVTIPSSVRKMPDGGRPAIANAPSKKIGPPTGTARTAPRILCIRR